MTKAPERRLEHVLARRIRELAAERDKPVSHFADRAGIARSHMWAVLNAERSATLALVQRLADALEVDPLELLRGEPARLRARRTRTKR
ncbi:MAG: helix-turn-helix transcriptional regulator [Myxococcales bacterium]|nr:helix-turn-helix transcriptional regulator [Myxococcales bacterium]